MAEESSNNSANGVKKAPSVVLGKLPRKVFMVVVFGLLTSAGCGGKKTAPAQVQALPSATTLPVPTLTAAERPVILFYQDGYSVGPQAPRNQVDVAVWSDGRFVWRANGPMRLARIDTKKIEELLQRLHREGVFGGGKVYYGNFGPDSIYDVIEVRLADRELELCSWNEGFEQNPNLVVTSHGVESLDGRARETVLAAEPKEYLRFRRIWSDIRSTVKAWTPTEGGIFTGTIRTGRGG